jgi:hypothetical protein
MSISILRLLARVLSLTLIVSTSPERTLGLARQQPDVL